MKKKSTRNGHAFDPKPSRHAIRSLSTILMVAVIFLCLTQVAFADSPWDGEGGSALKGYAHHAYVLFRRIALYLCTIIVAVNFFRCIPGNDKVIEEAINKIKYAIIALVCIYLLGIVIQVAWNISSSFGWNPWQGANNPWSGAIRFPWL